MTYRYFMNFTLIILVKNLTFLINSRKICYFGYIYN